MEKANWSSRMVSFMMEIGKKTKWTGKVS